MTLNKSVAIKINSMIIQIIITIQNFLTILRLRFIGSLGYLEKLIDHNLSRPKKQGINAANALIAISLNVYLTHPP